MNDGGPAFPRQGARFISGNNELYDFPPQRGMTLRQWYAGLAMLGEIANGYKTCSITAPLSVRAHEIADAMIEFEQREPQ